jgi:hypothetical protein
MNERLEVSKDALQKTVKCGNNFSCLHGDRNCLCELEDKNSSSNLCFIKNTQNKFCDYMLSFGFSYICTCPTRNEIHNRYAI